MGKILCGAHRVLVYAPELARFYDGLMGQPRARVVPWPFDYDAVRSLGRPAARRHDRTIDVVLKDRDRDRFNSTRFDHGLSIVVEGQRPYGAFVRFLASCDAVVNITASSVLGRVTFLAAALGKPGLFSDNAHLNGELYPSATVPLLQPALLRDALSALIQGLLAGQAPPAFMPDDAAARRRGDFAANAVIFRRLVFES